MIRMGANGVLWDMHEQRVWCNDNVGNNVNNHQVVTCNQDVQAGGSTWELDLASKIVKSPSLELNSDGAQRKYGLTCLARQAA